MSSAINTKNQFDAWLAGRSIAAAAPVQQDDDEDEEDSQDDEDQNNALLPPNPFARDSRGGSRIPYGRGSRPTPSGASYSVLCVVNSADVNSLETLSLLALAQNPFVNAYPHVRFAHILSTLPGFEKGTAAEHLEVTACPTFILFQGRRQVRFRSKMLKLTAEADHVLGARLARCFLQRASHYTSLCLTLRRSTSALSPPTLSATTPCLPP